MSIERQPTRRWVTVILLMAATSGAACATTSELEEPTPADSTSDATSPPVDHAEVTTQYVVTLADWSADGYATPWARQSLAEIADLGATGVTLITTWYQENENNSCFGPTEVTPQADALGSASASARQLGLAVTLKPMIDLTTGTERARIKPTDPDIWFSCYRRFMAEHVALANEIGAAQLVVGTELAGTSRNATQWRRIIQDVRAAFSGRLTYAANFSEIDQIDFWAQLDYIGINAYWPLSPNPETDVANLVASWQPFVTQASDLSTRHDRPTLLTELGYVSQTGTTTAPYDWTISPEPNEAEQAAAFTAARQAWSQTPTFAGVHIWMWDDAPGSLEQQHLDYTPNGKVAEEVLRGWFNSHPDSGFSDTTSSLQDKRIR